MGYEGGLNIYEYVWDSPTNQNDAWGLQAPAPGLGPPDPRSPVPWPPAGSRTIGIPNARSIFPIWTTWGGWVSPSKESRIRLEPIGEVETGLPSGVLFPWGPNSGDAIFYSPPYPRGTYIGGGGAKPCIIVVVNCNSFIAVFHFNPGWPGDSPEATMTRYRWPRDCHAIICGGDDNGRSNCIAEDAKDGLRRVGIVIDRISASDGCGYSVDDKSWYQSEWEDWGEKHLPANPD